MSMIRWDPIGDIARIRNEMDRMMSEGLPVPDGFRPWIYAIRMRPLS